MKEVSAEYIAKEEATVRNPTELYKMWCGDSYWYYTNGDIAVVFEGNTYEPAPITRGSIEFNSLLEVTNLTITAASITQPILEYIAQNPIDIVWIEVSRLFRDLTPMEKSVIFIGQIKSASFSGLQGQISCVGFEFFLKMPVPMQRYQRTCNHKVFDEKCGLSKEDYVQTVLIELDTSKVIIYADVFAEQEDGFYVGGFVQYMGESRSIIAHTGNAITIAYRMIALEDGVEIDIYPGCDCRIETCRDKFDNIIHFLGFPYIPDENPALRVP